jgi:hypothetical protein
MNTTPTMLTMLTLLLPAPAALADPPLATLAVAAAAPAIMIPAHTAVLMKRELDNQALFLHVDSAPERHPDVSVDAYVPLHSTDQPELFNAAFLEAVDEARARKRLGWNDAVVILSYSAFTAMQAADLLREHGYTLRFAVTSP